MMSVCVTMPRPWYPTATVGPRAGATTALRMFSRVPGSGLAQLIFRVLVGRRRSKAWPLPQFVAWRRVRRGQQRTLVGKILHNRGIRF